MTRLNTFLNSGIILSSFIGILYFGGYVYFDGFYHHLDIPIQLVDIPHKTFILYGTIPIFILAFIISIVLYYCFSIWSIFKRKKEQDKEKNEGEISKYGLDTIAGFWVIILFLFALYSAWPSGRGADDAQAKIDSLDCYKLTVKTESTELKKVCFLGKNSEGFWAIYFVPGRETKEVKFFKWDDIDDMTVNPR